MAYREEKLGVGKPGLRESYDEEDSGEEDLDSTLVGGFFEFF
jgi:hypothetical protein